MIRFAGMFLVLALSAMNAETYWLQIYQPVYLGGKELKTGEYKLDLQGDKLTFKMGKLAVESKVKLESLEQKAEDRRKRLSYDRGSLVYAAWYSSSLS